jgi:hypothetical protein
MLRILTLCIFVLAFSPLGIPMGKAGPQIFGMPYVLGFGFGVSLVLLLLLTISVVSEPRRAK